jgi:hypothetical protein
MNPVTYLMEWRLLGYGLFVLGLVLFALFSYFLTRDARRRGRDSYESYSDVG